MTAAPAMVGFQDERLSHDEDLRALHDLGAQFLFCANKIPVAKKWQNERPTAKDAISRFSLDAKGVGLVPASVGLVVVDVDASPAHPRDKANDKTHRTVARVAAVLNTLGPALTTAPSPSGGTHLFYKGTTHEGNMKWAYGDIRGTKGHVVLYDPAAALKAAQLVRNNTALEPVDVSLLRRIGSVNKHQTTPEPRHTPEGLEHLAEGRRNNYLNDGVFLDARDGVLTSERETEWRDAALASGLSSGDTDATMRSAAEAGEKAERPYSLSDTGNAQHFASMHADDLRYDHARGAWFQFNRQHWVQDRCENVAQLALKSIHVRQHAAVGNEAATKWGLRSLSRGSRDNLVRLARSEPPLSITGDQWDKDPWLVGVKGGVIPLKTGDFRDGQPEDLITKVIPVGYNPDAQAPRWIQFLQDVFVDNPDLVPYIRRVMGYTLTGDVSEQCFWLLHGEGSNGKSTLLETMEEVFGEDFSWHMPFPSTSWSDSASDYNKESLIGRRYVTTIEKSNRKELSSEIVKALTGNKRINARQIYKSPINFTIMAKFFLAVNEPPVIEDKSDGMWRRVKMVPFTRSFAVNRGFGATLLAEKEGILAWVVEGCLEWLRDGIQHPPCVDAATDAYRLESDPLLVFVEDQCIREPQCSVGATELFKTFQAWDDTKMTQRAFGARVRQLRGVTSMRQSQGIRYEGIGLKDLIHSDEQGEM